MIRKDSSHTSNELQSLSVKRSGQKSNTIDRLEDIRNAHSTKKDDGATDRMEDYLEVIYELVQHKGYATSTNVAEYLSVSKPSVTKMMRRLDRIGFINYEKYRGIRLTEKGADIARAIHMRHGIISGFFRMIGVDKDLANKDAEAIEHNIHSETLSKLQELLQHMKNV